MRLADLVMEVAGSERDVFGNIAKIAPVIRKAERFNLDEDVMAAAFNVAKSRPSSLLAAYPLCRLPYPTMWIEWECDARSAFVDDATPDRPMPWRMGCLIEDAGLGSNQAGVMTWLWAHRPKPGDEELGQFVDGTPIGVMFDWRDEPMFLTTGRDTVADWLASQKHDPGAAKLIREMLQVFFAPPDSAETTSRVMASEISRWAKFANDPREIEAVRDIHRHSSPWPSRFGWEMIFQVGRWAGRAEFGRRMAGWIQDISGETVMIEAVLALMNSRNVIEREPAKLDKLNRARTKRGKRPFLPYTTTRLTLTRVVGNAAKAHGMSREAARLHLVRGHFKIRRTGVFWWSPFPRGRGRKPVERKEYEVAK
jgi:hypothetical protein